MHTCNKLFEKNTQLCQFMFITVVKMMVFVTDPNLNKCKGCDDLDNVLLDNDAGLEFLFCHLPMLKYM